MGSDVWYHWASRRQSYFSRSFCFGVPLKRHLRLSMKRKNPLRLHSNRSFHSQRQQMCQRIWSGLVGRPPDLTTCVFRPPNLLHAGTNPPNLRRLQQSSYSSLSRLSRVRVRVGSEGLRELSHTFLHPSETNWP